MSKTNILEGLPDQHIDHFKLWEDELVGYAVLAHELEVDKTLRRQAESFIGQVVLRGNVDVVEEVTAEESEESNDTVSLCEATKRSKEGDLQAREMVKINMMTDYMERAYKKGFVHPNIEIETNEQGQLSQNGQTMNSVHANSLRYMGNEKMHARSKIEALNGHRDQYYAQNGLLKTKARVVASLVNDQMTDKEAADAGFFVPTKSIAIQLFTEHEGKLIIQTAFVSSRDAEYGDYDKEAIVKLAAGFGLDYSGMSSEEILASPMLIDKANLPELIDTIVETYDEASSGITGAHKFFGETVKSQPTKTEYADKRRECREVVAKMQHDIDVNVAKLIEMEPATPLETTEKLAELNDILLKQRIIADENIDARVLGTDIAWSVHHARYLSTVDPHVHANVAQDIAFLQRTIEKNGASSSCPGGASRQKDNLSGNVFDPMNDGNENQTESDSETPEDCEFISKECPKCGEKNVKTECKNGVYYGACGCKSE